MKELTESIKEKIRGLRLVVFDVDGVLTDGRIIYTESGDEIKSFDVRDGHGIKLLQRAGLECAIITSRDSRIVRRRAEELGIGLLYQGMLDKVVALEDILRRRGLRADEVAFIGDDLVDVPVMRRVGLPVAVRDAVDEVKDVALYVTERPGGRGAVREITEIILKIKGVWKELLMHYLNR